MVPVAWPGTVKLLRLSPQYATTRCSVNEPLICLASSPLAAGLLQQVCFLVFDLLVQLLAGCGDELRLVSAYASKLPSEILAG